MILILSGAYIIRALKGAVLVPSKYKKIILRERNSLLPILSLLFVTFAAYSNTLCNGFVYDDVFIIANNPFIQNLKFLSCLFSKAYFNISLEQTYRPLVTITYFSDYFFWAKNPFGYHLTNLLIHLVNVILVFLFAKILFKDKLKSWFTAAIFALHPAISEAVNCISYREDLLCFLFYIAAFILYLHKRYFWSILSFICALFSKEMAATFPFVLISYEAIQKDAVTCGTGKNKRIIVLYFAILALFLLVRFILFSNPQYIQPIAIIQNPIPTFLGALLIVLNYLRLLVLPLKLLADYTFFPPCSILNKEVITAFIVICSVIALAYLLKKTSRIFSFAVYWFFITLLPVLGFIKLSIPFAERYLYLPALGYSLCLALFFDYLLSRKDTTPRLWQKSRNILVCIIIFLVLPGFSLRTYLRNKVWKDQFVLWKTTFMDNPFSTRALMAMTFYSYKHLSFEQTLLFIDQLIKNAPQEPKIYVNLSAIYFEKNDLPKAKECLDKALSLDPKDSNAHYNLGIYYFQIDNIEQAVKEFTAVVERNYFDLPARNCLLRCYRIKGEIEKAAKEKQKITELDPNFQKPEDMMRMFNLF